MNKLFSILFVAILPLAFGACKGGSGSGSNKYVEPLSETYKITYDANGATAGTASEDGNNYETGDIVTVLDNTGNLQKTGYDFAGWSDGSITLSPSTTFTMGNENVTLYAKWTAVGEPEKYTVTYYENEALSGAAPVDTNEYEKGDTVIVPGNTGNLVKTGCTFGGWSTGLGGKGITFAEGQTFTIGAESVKLYAKWDSGIIAHSCYVSYSAGSEVSSGQDYYDFTQYEEGDTITVLGNAGNLVKTGYTFGGWNTTVDGKGITFAEGQTFTIGAESVKLYAKWDPETAFTVTYYANGGAGSVPADSTVYHTGDTVTVKANTSLKRTNYRFTGWNTNSRGTGATFTSGQTFTIDASVVLYAAWKLTGVAQTTFTADGISFKMSYVPDSLSCPTGIADESSALVKDAYWIAETELTYELWSKVYVWASGDSDMNGTIDSGETAGAYKFSNYGLQGNEDIHITLEGGYTPMTTNQYPVTNISWRDAMIFCNAMTEWYNKKNGTSYACAYCKDAVYTIPLRSSDDSTEISASPGNEDNPYVNTKAKGFRLLTSAEWELAARYIDGDQWLHGDHASGDISGPVFAPGGYGIGGQALSTIAIEYAVFFYEKQADISSVKSKIPNYLGLYDMSGNVYEWNFDWYPGSATTRICRGGAYAELGMKQQVGQIYNKAPKFAPFYGGMRIGKSAE